MVTTRKTNKMVKEEEEQSLLKTLLYLLTDAQKDKKKELAHKHEQQILCKKIDELCQNVSHMRQEIANLSFTQNSSGAF